MLTNQWKNDNIMKQVESMHPELSHLINKDLLSWNEYSLFLSVSMPIVK